MDFQISALDPEQFSHLFGQSAETLENRGVQRMIADCKPGYPCRVSLRDAEVGESLLLLNYEHQPIATPYRSSHAVFVREYAMQAMPGKNEVPQSLRQRLLSLRSFDNAGAMLDADVIEGANVEDLIERLLSDQSAEYIHIHNARRGCYAALAGRSL